MSIQENWSTGRNPPVGPTTGRARSATVVTAGGDPVETIALAALFPVAQYANWNPVAANISQDVGALFFSFQRPQGGGEWFLLVHNGSGAVPAGETVRVTFYPPGKLIT